jgi:RNA polymerase sigma-70 factor (ECF subfamily)
MNAIRPIIRDNEAEKTALFSKQLLAIIPSLQIFACQLCRNRDQADDLVQETLTRAWGARDSFTQGTNFRAWMRIILRHHFYTTISKNSRITYWDAEAAERILVQEPMQHSALHMADIENAISQLPAEQRKMLLLVCADGASYEEAAAISGCAMGTVKSRLARGRHALANIFDEVGIT